MSVQTVEPGPYGMSGAGPNYNAGRNVVATQPWNRVVFPDGGGGVWDPVSAMALPSVGRAVALIAGQIRQTPMDAYRGIIPLPRPRLLDQPDPNQARSWFVGQEVVDYLLHGNAIQYVTARDAAGFPAASVWLPASWVSITWNPGDPDYSDPAYWLGGTELNARNVIHVKRGADDRYPVRGIGVVEQHLLALSRVASAERYETEALSGSGVPSVAIITPNPRLSNVEAATAKEDWMTKFAGPNREPAILPAGTQVVPLAWSPTDAQLNETRALNLQDVANMFNLDGYFLGAPSSSMTYKSPGPMFLQLLRVTLEPILSDFEGVWSSAWLPRGTSLRFDRKALQQDDLQTTIATLGAAITAGIYSREEARIYLGLPPTMNGEIGPSGASPIDTTAADVTDAEQPEPDDESEIAS
jgi:HK97 family phage portal protein